MTFIAGFALGALVTIGMSFIVTAADNVFDKDNHYD